MSDRDDITPQQRPDDDELSVEELEEAAGGVLDPDNNCGNNCHCSLE